MAAHSRGHARSFLSARRPRARAAAVVPAPVGRVDVCGVPIDPVTVGQAVDLIVAAVAQRRPMQVCTVNLQFLVSAARDRRVRRIMDRSGLNVADGAPVLWLAQLAGQRLPERVAGADLVPELMAAAAERGLGVFLLGGQDGVAEDAAATLRFRYPGLRVVGVLEPPVGRLDRLHNDEILGEIERSGADIVLVALGHPRQELWVSAHRERLSAPVAIGVGCTFDLLAGRRDRAPVWMQHAGLEWLFRASHEPRRLTRRYATQLLWLSAVLGPEATRRRVHRDIALPRLNVAGRAVVSTDPVVEVGGRPIEVAGEPVAIEITGRPAGRMATGSDEDLPAFTIVGRPADPAPAAVLPTVGA